MVLYPDKVVFDAVRWGTMDIDILRAFLAGGGVVNTNEVREYSLLHAVLDHPCQFDEDLDRYTIIQLLLGAGADWKKQDNEGNTPLHVAANYSHNHFTQLIAWAQKHGDSDFIHMLNDAGYTALDSLPHPRTRWLPPSSPEFNRLQYISGSRSLAHNAELLMALGARVSREVVIMLRLMVMPPGGISESIWGIFEGYARVADSAAWVYESRRAMDASVLRTNAILPADISVLVNEKQASVYDTAHRERFTRAIEWLNKVSVEQDEGAFD